MSCVSLDTNSVQTEHPFHFTARKNGLVKYQGTRDNWEFTGSYLSKQEALPPLQFFLPTEIGKKTYLLFPITLSSRIKCDFFPK